MKSTIIKSKYALIKTEYAMIKTKNVHFSTDIVKNAHFKLSKV